MSQNDILEKQRLRQKFLAERAALPLREVSQKSNEIMKRLLSLPVVKNASSIALYMAIKKEVQTISAIEHFYKKKTILLPVTKDKIYLAPFTSFEDLRLGSFNILEPISTDFSRADSDVIVVPGVVFDKRKYRIGYGKGFYDKLLKTSNSITIGVCFDFQVIPKIPHMEHDQPMDYIITEKRIIK